MDSKIIRVAVGAIYLLTALYHSLGIIWFGIQSQPLIASVPMLLIIVSLITAAFYSYGQSPDTTLTKFAISIGLLGVISCVVVGLVWKQAGGELSTFLVPLAWTAVLLSIYVYRTYRGSRTG